MKNKIKILFVLQTPWGSGLGMSQVHQDLKTIYEKLGYEVDYLDHRKLYPRNEGILTHFIGKSTQKRILHYLKKNAYKYDIIDANQRCIPYSKELFGFKGVLLYRSHGLPPIYRIVEESPFYKKMTYTDKNINDKTGLRNYFGNLLRHLTIPEGEWALWDSIRYADLVHCLNTAEYDYLKNYGIDEKKLVMIPNGIDKTLLETGEDFGTSVTLRTDISFLGTWSIRKGIVHLPMIAETLKNSYNQFNLLGTLSDKDAIITSFDINVRSKISIVNQFNRDELAQLVKTTKVAVFPSYVEGFGLAVLEFLAFGIPVVAFDTPGPTDILAPIDQSLLVGMGDEKAMIDKVINIINLSAEDYNVLCKKCYQRATDFHYSLIAQQFLNVYDKCLIGNMESK